MNERKNTGCPRIEDLSALMDGVLAGGARREMTEHAASCPLCGAALRDFEAMRNRIHALQETRCDVDIASLIASRLPRSGAYAPRGRAWRWPRVWQAAPRGLGAAAALAAGVYVGLLLPGGALAPRPPAMAVFDAAPPGSLCAGLSVCSPRGR
jgi:anti-sigma factor RsiW